MLSLFPNIEIFGSTSYSQKGKVIGPPFSPEISIYGRILQRISRMALYKEYSIKMGGNDRLKPDMGNETRQFSVSLLRYSGSGMFSNFVRFLDTQLKTVNSIQ